MIRRAIDELHAYLKRKMSEVRDTERLLQSSDLNYRQVALLGKALRHADATFTYKSHATNHRVALESARLDLLDLEERGLLEKRKAGRQMVFHPVEDLADLVADEAKEPRQRFPSPYLLFSNSSSSVRNRVSASLLKREPPVSGCPDAQ